MGKRLRPPEFGKWSLETLENLETNWILRELFLLGAVGGIGRDKPCKSSVKERKEVCVKEERRYEQESYKNDRKRSKAD